MFLFILGAILVAQLPVRFVSVRREAALVHPCVDFRVSSFHERRAHTFSIGPLVATYEGAFAALQWRFALCFWSLALPS